uniref:Trypsin inhibitor n=1 Tax=Descurainia sophia TaxID=89411 RepID=B9VS65_DESSO|nr:trypsin inhibitor [Descurainia sophia]
MVMAMKSVSTFAIFCILFLVIFETSEIEAQLQERQCLKEYGGDVGFSFCAPRIFPSFCDRNCRNNKGAKGGICRWEQNNAIGVRCLCDFCGEEPSNLILSRI